MITVSSDTMKILRGLPKLDIAFDAEAVRSIIQSLEMRKRSIRVMGCCGDS